MNVTEADLPGVLLIEPAVFGDQRGSFLETYQALRYDEAGMPQTFVQDNLSRSSQGVIRGLHLQKTRPQGKLVMATYGTIFDVVADVDPASPTFGKHISFVLDDEQCTQVYVPPGYAHGFQVLTPIAHCSYKCTEFYQPDDEGGVIWNDPDLAIDWPLANPELSPKDLALPTLRQLTA